MSEQVEDFPRDEAHRFRLYRLCDCPGCDGVGKVRDGAPDGPLIRCPLCRGEGKVRDCLAAAESPEALGVALVTLGREGELRDCAVGVLDVLGGAPGEPKWVLKPWLPSPRNRTDAARLLASGRKATP